MTSKDPVQRHLLGQVDLHEYFDSEDDMTATLVAVRYKVVATFLKSVHPRTGKTTGRDNYICGVDAKISDLADYVAEHTNLRREFSATHLSKPLEMMLTRHQRQRLVRRIHARLICVVLVAMRDASDLWYMEGVGDWLFSNTLRIEHDRAERLRREATNTYHGDRRNWHGRPSNQGRRRSRQNRFAPGTSIGGIS